MSVADFMTKKVSTVTPDTKINVAISIMKEQNIHRLPVLSSGKLVGIITQRDIERATPSEATSLSIYEITYLLNKMTVVDVMSKNVKTVNQDAFLEDAIYVMRQSQIGVLPVMNDDELVGIITNNDILDAFLDVTDYAENATAVQVFVAQDHPGIIFEIGEIMKNNDLNIQTLMVTHQDALKIVEIHVDQVDGQQVVNKLSEAGFKAQEAKHYKEQVSDL
ncbi:CBS domain-containing protein [Lentilactobacillus sp. SPB1-3]|uniref:CBS domain-containing protein n=1 Tax=Lentilactobacillus terminaliae TaxID=3003483 RepID=A0ACD5DG35_9LACO|nr:CBS domain-containing protein [Lentilactobacillus sp. SPB1-3]MCZ0976710.1 CBS domain-containing protein [Lentilactobacillus sp. SPB1-3]